MYISKRLTQVFESADEIPFDDSSKFVFFSDCHRGVGGWADDFVKNQNYYFAALTHYYMNSFTYIEIGDGDELWENRKFSEIMYAHRDVFGLLSKFYKEKRLYFIFGNHDIVKRDIEFIKNNFYYYFDERKKRKVPLFENIKIHEGLILRHRETGDKIFIVHGHQADFLNDRLWRLSCFLVRYLWSPLEFLGVNDPTSPAKNNEKKKTVEKKITDWVSTNKQMLIAGHTHRPMFPEVGDPPYFNDGSCVHPHSITAIEISMGYISLVKWSMKTKIDGTLFVDRDVLAGPRKIKHYFSKKTLSRGDLASV